LIFNLLSASPSSSQNLNSKKIHTIAVTQFTMPTTRGSQGGPSPPAISAKATATKKRAAADSSAAPKAKRGRPSKKTEQKTIEEMMPESEDIEDDNVVADQLNGKSDAKEGGDDPKDEEMVTNGDGIEDDKVIAEQINGEGDDEKNADGQKDEAKDDSNATQEKNAFDEVKADETEIKKAATEEQDKKTEEISQNNTSVIEDEKREAAIPSSILEKGIIYFFFRPCVNITEPQGIEDVARSFIVLRPLPLGAKLGDGPLEDSGNARLLALPKKMLPKSKRDRFLIFVDKANAHIKDLREQFAGNEYATKTVGYVPFLFYKLSRLIRKYSTSTTEPATPFAEGVYAITSTGRESHLAYQLTVPSTIGEIQKELGLHEKGSFVVSAKNPEAPGPANATLDNPAKYPESLQKKFRNLRWMPLEPALLDYEGTQVLFIGEGLGDLGRSVEEMSKDAKDDEKEKPVEEIEKLEEEVSCCFYLGD
jgi:hypothetical protein